jgi:alkylated DNA repair protein alkB family protein 6
MCQRFSELKVFQGTKHGEPNHCLINEYEPGQGIMPHEDGGAYASVVATVSLGAPIVLDLYERSEEGHARGSPIHRLLQEERSLLVTRGEAYEVLLHGIGEQHSDVELMPDEDGVGGAINWNQLGDKERFASGTVERQTRVSLTFRDVLKVSKMGARLLGKK